MKIILIILAILAALILVGMFVLAQQSQSAPTLLGLEKGRFKPCAYVSNCVNSMESGSMAIAPLAFKGDANEAWSRTKGAVVETGGEIQTESDTYLWVTFRSKWFGFVDDMELSLDADSGVIHVRSSSRVGRSDFGVNRKRVEQIRALYLP